MEKVNLTLTRQQLRLIESALELYMRLGIGQLEIVGEKLLMELFYKMFKDRYSSSKEIEDKFLRPMKQEMFGFGPGASFGISSDKVHDGVKIGYDLQKVIQKHIATVEDHHKYSVWHDGPMLHLGSEPIAEISEID
jgi:hypothetical protein